MKLSLCFVFLYFLLTKVCTNSVLNNLKKPLKRKTKDINSQSKANKYIYCIGK